MTLLTLATTTYKRFILGYLVKHSPTKELAEDLYQDVIIKIMAAEKAGKYVEAGKAKAWLITITANILRDHWRRLSTTKRRDDVIINSYSTEVRYTETLESEVEESIQDVIEKENTYMELYQNIDKIPKKEIREAIKLRYLQEMDFKTIAEVTGVSINTALGRTRYGLKYLRKLYNNECTK